MSEEKILSEIRSEEVQEILGYIPHWIIKMGISIIFVIILLLILSSWYFKYPDIISSPISITTENPPALLLARTNGKISMLFVSDKQIVQKGEILAIIENTANFNHVFELRQKLDSLQTFFLQYNSNFLKDFNSSYQLGSIQSSYSIFSNNYNNYLNFLQLDFHSLKILAITKQLKQIKYQISAFNLQSDLLKEEVVFAARQFSRDSCLYASKVIPLAEFSFSIITRSLFESSAFVASSRKMYEGFLYTARAIKIRCFWP